MKKKVVKLSQRAGLRGKQPSSTGIQGDSIKENHLFPFSQFTLLFPTACTSLQLSIPREGGERRPALSGAVKKYIYQQQGKIQKGGKEPAVPKAELATAFYLLMGLFRSHVGECSARGTNGSVGGS